MADKYFSEQYLVNMKDYNAGQSNSNRTDIACLISNIRDIALRNANTRIDFENKSALSDCDYASIIDLSNGRI